MRNSVPSTTLLRTTLKESYRYGTSYGHFTGFAIKLQAVCRSDIFPVLESTSVTLFWVLLFRMFGSSFLFIKASCNKICEFYPVCYACRSNWHDSCTYGVIDMVAWQSVISSKIYPSNQQMESFYRIIPSTHQNYERDILQAVCSKPFSAQGQILGGRSYGGHERQSEVV